MTDDERSGAERAFPAAAHVADEAVKRHEARLHAAPPRPIPPYLYPLDVPLGPEDLILVATRSELAALTTACKTLDLDPALLRIVHRDGSPWIEFAAVKLDREARPWSHAVGALAVDEPERFALWRYTLAVYRVGDDGAVEDDPVWQPTERTQ